MKKRWVLLLALFLMLAGCTGSCGREGVTGSVPPGESIPPPASAAPLPTPTPVESAGAVPTPTAAPTISPVPDLQPTPTPEPEPEDTPDSEPVEEAPSDEEVLECYRLAQQAFAWFQVAPLPFDPTDSREVEGVLYYRVDYPGIGSLSSLRGYLKGLFSDALVEELLPYGSTQYLDFDGVLYVQDGGRGTNLYRGAEYTQVMRGDNPNRLVVRVTVEEVDPELDDVVTGTVTYDFPYEKVGERWIFTDFSLVR